MPTASDAVRAAWGDTAASAPLPSTVLFACVAVGSFHTMKGGNMRFDKRSPDLVSSRQVATVWRHAGHHHVLPWSVSRRHFLQAAAGGTALGAVLGAGLLRPQRVEGAGSSLEHVKPIPGTLEFFGKKFHVLGPPLTAPDDDPSTVFNFSGTTGIAFISGTCKRTNLKNGEERELPFSFNDMRFMQGIYRGHGGHTRVGTFVFV
jgi:hypothetical protein